MTSSRYFELLLLLLLVLYKGVRRTVQLQAECIAGTDDACGGFALKAAYEYCIIGAGPGGLQLGQLLLEQGVDYVVLDKAAAAGSFYEQYPRHRCCMRSAEFSPPRHNTCALVSAQGTYRYSGTCLLLTESLTALTARCSMPSMMQNAHIHQQTVHGQDQSRGWSSACCVGV